MPWTARRLLAIGLLLVAGNVLAEPAPVNAPHWPASYDHYFRKYTKHYFGPFWDWRWFKAQAIVESTLERGAQNPSGAVGLMQILPSTYAEIRQSNQHFGPITEPRWNIAAGIYYDHYLYSQPLWSPLRGTLRLMASFAAYNAGFGRASQAYEQTPKPITAWAQMAPRLPLQTQDYVKRIVRVKTGHHPRPAHRGLAALLATWHHKH
ncbi:MAG TPA: transglycosylase SLT domain-containing protein [Nevskiaceae bacterium]|nr:transglycosylase SLT domain-containing protein [Nevskiaceae bacterium]